MKGKKEKLKALDLRDEFGDSRTAIQVCEVVLDALPNHSWEKIDFWEDVIDEIEKL